MSEGKYYWLRLKRDFFKRHDIQIVESMDNGKDYILFYLKLICESVDHEGRLRFSDDIPYSDRMLATVTNTNIDIVRSAIDAFTRLGMMEILDDGTYFMSEVEKMIGSSSQDEHVRESTRLRVQAYRERKKAAQIQEKRYGNVTCNGEIELEIEKEIDKDICKKKTKKFEPPTLEEIEAYCKQRKNNVDPQEFYDYFTEGKWVDARGHKVINWKQKILTWEKFNPSAEPKKQKFSNIETHDYDFEDLEKKLLGG